MENVFSVRPTGKFPEKVDLLKRQSRFPGWNVPMEICVPFTEFLVFITSSMPFAVFSAARLPWAPSCFQKMAADPGQVSVSFLQTNFRATTSALPATF